jgi:hypothetical protein
VFRFSINSVGVRRREICTSKRNLARFHALSETEPLPQWYCDPHTALCAHCGCEINNYAVRNWVLAKTNRIFNVNLLIPWNEYFYVCHKRYHSHMSLNRSISDSLEYNSYSERSSSSTSQVDYRVHKSQSLGPILSQRYQSTALT